MDRQKAVLRVWIAARISERFAMGFGGGVGTGRAAISPFPTA